MPSKVGLTTKIIVTRNQKDCLPPKGFFSVRSMLELDGHTAVYLDLKLHKLLFFEISTKLRGGEKKNVDILKLTDLAERFAKSIITLTMIATHHRFLLMITSSCSL